MGLKSFYTRHRSESHPSRLGKGQLSQRIESGPARTPEHCRVRHTQHGGRGEASFSSWRGVTNSGVKTISTWGTLLCPLLPVPFLFFLPSWQVTNRSVPLRTAPKTNYGQGQGPERSGAVRSVRTTFLPIPSSDCLSPFLVLLSTPLVSPFPSLLPTPFRLIPLDPSIRSGEQCQGSSGRVWCIFLLK